MPGERRHESADLEDYEVLNASDTLDGARSDDPLDGGVVTPDRWSAVIRFGTTSAEQQTGESLDQALAQKRAATIWSPMMSVSLTTRGSKAAGRRRRRRPSTSWTMTPVCIRTTGSR